MSMAEGGVESSLEGNMEDFFSRQRAVPDWYQPLIELQTVLLLGVGGIGCSVARNIWLELRETVLGGLIL